MESLDTAAYMVEDLLDFSSDVGEEDLSSSSTPSTNPDDPTRSSFPDCVEEELEWLSNKDAFPTVDTFVDIITINPGRGLKHRSPISVLENSSSSSNCTTIMSCCGGFAVPVRRARTKRRRKHRRGSLADLLWFSNQLNINNNTATKASNTVSIGRKCQHCQVEKTPQWRAGPVGPKTLCNACGVRYKSGRLVPEYRPANSPTFSSKLHSNSHRKVVEMRKQKQCNIMVNASMDQG